MKSPSARCFIAGGAGEWSLAMKSSSPASRPCHSPSRSTRSRIGGAHLNAVAPSGDVFRGKRQVVRAGLGRHRDARRRGPRRSRAAPRSWRRGRCGCARRYSRASRSAARSPPARWRAAGCAARCGSGADRVAAVGRERIAQAAPATRHARAAAVRAREHRHRLAQSRSPRRAGTRRRLTDS